MSWKLSVKKNKNLFYTCLFVSIGVHLGAGWVFYNQPLFLRPYFGSLAKKPSSISIPLTDEDIALSEKNISLEEVMGHIIELPMQEQLFPGSLYLTKTEELPSLEKGDEWQILSSISTDTPSKILMEKPSLAVAEIPIPPTIFEEEFILPEDPASFISTLAANKSIESDYIKNIEESIKLEEGDLLPELRATLNTHYSVLAETSLPLNIPQELELPNILSLEEESLKGSPTTSREFLIQAPEFHFDVTTPPTPFKAEERASPSVPHSKSPTLANSSLSLETVGKSWDEGFDVEVCTMQREEGGYFFSVTLLPKYDMSRKQMHQNYYFLIDRTNSIGKHRYQTFKKAVNRALGSLEEGSRFNIIVFDKKISSLNEKPLAYSKKSLQMAEAFLEKQNHGSYFNAADLCKSLSKIIPDNVQADEATSVILITDGDSSLNQEKQRKIIQSFLKKNNGKLSLYAAAVGEGNNLNFLDLLSSVNKGYLLYSDTHASFPRKLTKLVLDLLHPIAKDVIASIVKSNPKSQIKLHPSAASLPCLFSKQPYTIYGTADTLSDFTLVLQGKNKDQIFTIKKNISFTRAKNDTRALSKHWSQKQAHVCYEEYLKNGETALLDQAKSFLSDSDKFR